MNFPPNPHTIFIFNKVPVKARPGFLAALFMLWSVMIWLDGKRRPERPFAQRLAVGTLSAFLGIFADLGHAMAHTVSARRTGAPMDTILLGADMPRTLYADNDVPPQVHRMRALGGPTFSLVGFVSSLLWRRFAAPGTVQRELADVSTFSHAGIFFGSLLPLPIVDGGTILKWTLVENGQSEAQADQSVRTAALVSSILAGVGLLIAAPVLWKRIIFDLEGVRHIG